MKKLKNPIINDINIVEVDYQDTYYTEYTDGFIVYHHRFKQADLRFWVLENYDISRGQVKIELDPTSIEQAENPIYFTQDVEEFINENYEELILAMLKQPVLACQSSLGSAIYNICKPR
jgi:hypothetical protein